MLRALIASAVVILIATFPATWLLMLFLGNVDLQLSYWGTLPLGVLVSVLLGGVASGAASRSYPGGVVYSEEWTMRSPG